MPSSRAWRSQNARAYSEQLSTVATVRGSPMSKVARRKELLATPAISMTAIVPTTGRTRRSCRHRPPLCYGRRPSRSASCISSPSSRPFARSGGLGEAVNSLARFQAASGIRRRSSCRCTTRCSATAPDIEPVGPAFRVQVGPRSRRGSTLATRSLPPDHPLAATRVYFIESEEYFARPYIYGPPGSDYLDNARRYACFTVAALECAADDRRRRAGAAPRARLAHGARAGLSPHDASRRTSAIGA